MSKMILEMEASISDKCDQFWGQNECPNEVAYIVEHKGTTIYALMCEVHCANFITTYGLTNIIVHPWTEELNKLFAERAKKAQEG